MRLRVALTAISVVIAAGASGLAGAATAGGSAPRTAARQGQIGGASAVYQWGGGVDTPTVVGGLSDIVTIRAGNASAMALDANGTVWTWGSGANYDLGDGSTTWRTAAVRVKGLPPIVSMGESYDTDVALTATGTAYGWGGNEDGKLCTGTTAPYRRPVELTNLSGVVAVAGGGNHFLYLTSKGTVKACGGNGEGELGDGTTTSSATPVDVRGLPSSHVTAISAGSGVATVLLANGQVWDWGRNNYGQLGDGTTTNSDVPVRVELPGPAAEVYQGGSLVTNGQSLALLTDGQVWGWGNDTFGQLGDGKSVSARSVPVQATDLPSDITDVVTGGGQSLALDAQGDVWAWGADAVGEVGNGSGAKVVFKPVVVLTGATAISATAADSVALVPGI